MKADTDLASDLKLRSTLPSLPSVGVLHSHPHGLHHVQLAPLRLQHVARGDGDLVAAADGVPDGVVLAGEAHGLGCVGEGDDPLSTLSLAYRHAGGIVCTR